MDSANAVAISTAENSLPARCIAAVTRGAISLSERGWLAKAGHPCEVVTDPALLPERLPAFRPDVLLLDVQFGTADGFEICASLRAAPATPS